MMAINPLRTESALNCVGRVLTLLTMCAMWLGAALSASAVTVSEEFSSDPLGRDWRVFGDTNLIHWSAANQNLEVTWDSSRPNTYFYLPLKNILCSSDDFGLSFDLAFQDYACGTTSNKPYAAEVAIGFLNLDNATQTNFSRGAGISASYGPKNLVEFNFFPPFDVFLPTIAQTMVATNNSSWLYNHDNLLEMTPGELFNVATSYSSSNHTLTTVTTHDGVQYGVTQTITVPTNFDFRVATFSVSSYSDQHSSGSIRAQGWVDNIVLTLPPPPVQGFRGYFSNHQWCAEFKGRSNWTYTLERTTNLPTWVAVVASTSASDGAIVLQDTDPPILGASYRVRAQRP
jgi:hypothetical protein